MRPRKSGTQPKCSRNERNSPTRIVGRGAILLSTTVANPTHKTLPKRDLPNEPICTLCHPETYPIFNKIRRFFAIRPQPPQTRFRSEERRVGEEGRSRC